MSAEIVEQLVSFFFASSAQGKIQSISIDAIISEQASYQSTVTDEPVETGEEITDHIVNHAQTVDIKGVITDSPYGETFDLINQNSDNMSRSKSAYESLLALWANKTIFDVVSGFDIYTDMAFTNFTINRDANSGKAIDFNASFKHIVRVSPQHIKIPADNTKTTPVGNQDQTQSTTNDGTQQPKDKDDLHKRSVAAALADIFNGQLKYSELGGVIE